MTDSGPPKPVLANLFHSGNTCPHCQETIADAQLIVTCPDCGSIHHELCWSHKGGCASYHCDESVRNEAKNLQPDIIIGAGELKDLQLPPARISRPAADVARRFLPKKPERLSRLAVVSAVLAGLAALGLAGVVSGSMKGVALGIALAIAAMAVGVIALVAINTGRKVSGFRVAAAGIILPALLTVVYFFSLQATLRGRGMQFRTDLKLAENRPTEEQLARVQAPKARALRANVVIKFNGGLMGSTTYGSGIVAKVTRNRAFILTNKHVIGNAKGGEIEILFYSGESSSAKVEWTAPGDIDLAFVSCQTLTLDKYEPIPLADYLARQGQSVFAVGNPMGLSWSYTEGIISGIRSSRGGEREIDIYQTQTPINTGNSGGGLYSMNGILMGINTWTQDKAVAEGLNFATTTTSLLRLLSEAERERLLTEVVSDEDADY